MSHIDWSGYQTIAETAERRYRGRQDLLDFALDRALRQARSGQLDTAYSERFFRQAEIDYSRQMAESNVSLSDTEPAGPEMEVADWDSLDRRIMATVTNPRYGEYVQGVARMIADGYSARDISGVLGGSLMRVSRARATLRVALA